MGQKRNVIYDEAYKVYLEGYSLNQVAEQLNVTRQCVFKAFKKRGFMLRGVNYQPKQVYDGKTFTLRNTGYFSLTTGNRTLMHRYVWEKEVGKIPSGYDIHHIDGDKTNNDIKNLECLSKADHTSRYSPHHNQYNNNKTKHLYE